MPDFWSHHFAALNIQKKLVDKQLRHVTWSEHCNNLYTLGAQGPDFFYYINKMNPLSKYHFSEIGNRVHEENIANLFTNMLAILLDEPTQERIAYLSGFISHYILDVHCHPLICELGPTSDSHKRVEMDLDALCLYDYWHLTLRQLDVKKLTCDEDILTKGFVSFWEKLLPLSYNAQVPAKFLAKGHYDLLKIQSILVNGIVDKLPFSNVIGKLLHYDLNNLRFPDLSSQSLKTERKYQEFITHYEDGMAETIRALLDLDQLISSEISVETYIARFIKFDFLGEAQNYVQPST